MKCTLFDIEQNRNQDMFYRNLNEIEIENLIRNWTENAPFETHSSIEHCLTHSAMNKSHFNHPQDMLQWRFRHIYVFMYLLHEKFSTFQATVELSICVACVRLSSASVRRPSDEQWTYAFTKIATVFSVNHSSSVQTFSGLSFSAGV